MSSTLSSRFRHADARLVARAIAFLCVTCAVGACAWVMLSRLLYPFDLEWMTGSELDHIERIQRGLPVYTAPTSDWIPFLYPPFYYYVSNYLDHLVHDLRLSARLVSLSATFAQAYLIWRSCRRFGASKYWSYVALGAFCAAYPFVEYWYDIERPDSLFTAVLLLALCVLEEWKTIWGAVIGGLILGFAFFVKQPALIFAVAAAVGFLITGKLRHAIGLAIATGVVVFGGVHYFNARTDGWFSFYVLQMPRAHGISISLLPQLLRDFGKAWLYVAATIAVFGWFLARFRHGAREHAVPVAFLAAALASSGASRLHVGGWPNVLMFWTAFASIAVGVVGTKLEQVTTPRTERNLSVRRWAAIALPLLVALQLGQLAYAPWDHVPTASAANLESAFVAHVKQLETKGEVLTMGVGHLTAARHFHDAAFFDLLYVEKRVPQTILADVENQRFAAIVIDNFDDLWLPYEPAVGDTFFRAVASRYFVAERIDERLPACSLGFQIKPSWTLLPRKVALDEHAPIEELLKLQQSEVAIAQAREDAERRHTDAGAVP